MEKMRSRKISEIAAAVKNRKEAYHKWLSTNDTQTTPQFSTVNEITHIMAHYHDYGGND